MAVESSGRDILITVRPNLDMSEIEKKIQELENEKIKVKCSVDVDGKEIKMDIQDALSKIKSGELNQKIHLEFDTSALNKDLSSVTNAIDKSKMQDRIKSLQTGFVQMLGSIDGTSVDNVIKGMSTQMNGLVDECTRLKQELLETKSKLESLSGSNSDMTSEANAWKESYSRVSQELTELKSKMDSLNKADGITLPTDKFSKLIEMLEKLNSSILEVKSSLGTMDDAGNFQSYLSSLTQIESKIASLKDTIKVSISKSSVEGLTSLSKLKFDGLKALNGIDLSKVSNIGSGKNFSTFINGVKELSSIDKKTLSNLSSLNKLDLSGFNNLNVRKGSITNLVEAIKEMSSISSLKNLQVLSGLDFSGLSNLGSSGYANSSKILQQQVKDLMNSQTKYIDASMSRLRKAGLQEDQLSELKGLRTSLVSEMSTPEIFANADLSGTMSNYVQSISEAVSRADQLAQSMKQVKEATSQAGKDMSSYSSLLKEWEKLWTKQVNKGLGEQDTERLKQVNTAMKALEKEYKGSDNTKYQNMQALKSSFMKDLKQSYSDKLDKLYSSYQDDYINKFTEKDFINGDQFSKLKTNFEELTKLKSKWNETNFLDSDDLDRVRSLSTEMDNLINNLQFQSTSKGTFLTNIDTSDMRSAVAEAQKYIQQMNAVKVTFDSTISSEGNGAFTTFTYTLRNQQGGLEKWKASIDNATGALSTLYKGESEYVSQGQQVINSIKGKFAELTKYIGVMDLVQKSLTFVKSGIQSVIDINSAMTELKKVTDETSESYANFQKESGETAQKIGSTGTELINATADYARVGYSMEEAAKLAESSAVLMNVSEFDTISQATDALISMKQAYTDLSAEEIVNKLNAVGNAYSISTEDLASGLQKSSSVLSLMGNSIDEAAALITAGDCIAWIHRNMNYRNISFCFDCLKLYATT